MSLPIEKDRVVSIHYTLTNTDGDVLDSSSGRDPLSYLHGAGSIIAGLESALAGRQIGEALQVTIQPEDAYGLPNPDLVQTVPRDAFSGVEQLEVGMSFQAQGQEGQVQQVTIAAIAGDDVTVDGNHALAGQVLNFDVTIETVRDATAEEIAHGHAH